MTKTALVTLIPNNFGKKLEKYHFLQFSIKTQNFNIFPQFFSHQKNENHVFEAQKTYLNYLKIIAT